MPRVILFYKPYGVLSQFTPEPGTAHRTLRDFLDIPGVYAAGRLDYDSEGLLILTDDGDLQHALTDPRFAHTRTYWAQVEGVPSADALGKLSQGVETREYKTRPAKVKVLEPEPALPPRNPPIRFRAAIPTTWIEITLTEGRNRQVRRMTAAVGHPTLRLVRVSSGEWTIDGLQPGEWREVTTSGVPRSGSPPRGRKDRSRKPARSARANWSSR